MRKRIEDYKFSMAALRQNHADGMELGDFIEAMPSIDEWEWKQFKLSVIDKKKFKNPKRKMAATNRTRDESTKQFVKKGVAQTQDFALNHEENSNMTDNEKFLKEFRQ